MWWQCEGETAALHLSTSLDNHPTATLLSVGPVCVGMKRGDNRDGKISDCDKEEK